MRALCAHLQTAVLRSVVRPILLRITHFKMLQCRTLCLGRGNGRVLMSTAHESLSKYLHSDNVQHLKPNRWLNIEFPFSTLWAPKGFDSAIDDKTNTLKFLLTQQRLELLLEVHQLTTLSQSRSGLVFAGPHGLGKSAVCY